MLLKTETVPVGEYRITADRNRELLTVVGSCVAVVLYDARQHLTGMLHAVLPGDRSQYRDGDRYAWYADTGVHLLIQEMIRQGAEKENLQAVLAGGANLLSLGKGSDIGIRNTRSVAEHLGKNSIPVIRNETGGNLARRVRVSAADGQVSVISLAEGIAQPESGNTEQNFAPHDLKLLCRQIMNLRPHPVFAGNLLTRVHQSPENIDWEKIRVLIFRDLPFALHFFRVLNSPCFGKQGEIFSFECGLRHFGPVAFRRICVVTALAGCSEYAETHRKISKSGLSRHCLAAALIAQHLAKNREPEFREKAFTAAMLHGTGALPRLLFQKHNLFDFKENIFPHQNIGYGRLGGLILSGFGIPENLCAAVISHEFPEGDGRKNLPFSAYVHMGCALSRMLGFTTDAESPLFLLSPEILGQMRPDRELSALLPEILEKIKANGLTPGFAPDDAQHPPDRFFLASWTDSD
ncbi:MAG: HDOD domain-containing protein [Desulfobacterales bacterium]